MVQVLNKTERTRLRRAHQRGHYDTDTIHAILDAQPLSHLAYVLDGSPVCMPTIQWREGDRVYWHASSAGRGVKAALAGEVCLSVSILDGLVLARSAFHHSVNFRSVLVFGQPELVEDAREKADKLGRLIDHLYPGRNGTLRPMTDQEIKATAVLSLPIDEASAKIRTGGPVDDEADYALPIWAGVLPVGMSVGAAIPDPKNIDGVEMPQHLDAVQLG